jgi:hypothetical protein
MIIRELFKTKCCFFKKSNVVIATPTTPLKRFSLEKNEKKKERK